MIRSFEDKDLDTVIKIFFSASKVAHYFLSEEFLEKEKRNIKEVYIPNTVTYVFTENEEVLGFISMIGNEIGGLFVYPDYQRKNIGKSLLEYVKNLNGNLILDVFEKNEIGKSFYYKNGFEKVNESIHKETGEKLLRLFHK